MCEFGVFYAELTSQHPTREGYANIHTHSVMTVMAIYLFTLRVGLLSSSIWQSLQQDTRLSIRRAPHLDITRHLRTLAKCFIAQRKCVLSSSHLRQPDLRLFFLLFSFFWGVLLLLLVVCVCVCVCACLCVLLLLFFVLVSLYYYLFAKK